jgi:hypothetical protein
MNLSDLFERLEVEFELEIPEDAEDSLLCVQDVRNYVREIYKEQGIEVPSGAIFERIRRMIALLAHVDASAIRPETKLSEIEHSEARRAWV